MADSSSSPGGLSCGRPACSERRQRVPLIDGSAWRLILEPVTDSFRRRPSSTGEGFSAPPMVADFTSPSRT